MIKNKKSTQFNSKSMLLALISFILGGIATYFLITSTNYIPLNYQVKFKEIYDTQKRDRNWETYIDLVNGYVINYPNRLYVDLEPRADSAAAKGNFTYWDYKNLFHISTGGESVPAYDPTITFSMAKLKDTKLMDFAKNNTSKYESATKFQQTSINGDDAVIADLIITEELDKNLRALSVKGLLEPVGLKRQTVYILHNGFVYILQSGSLFADTEVERFEKILHSLKFLY